MERPGPTRPDRVKRAQGLPARAAALRTLVSPQVPGRDPRQPPPTTQREQAEDVSGVHTATVGVGSCSPRAGLEYPRVLLAEEEEGS